MATAPAFPGYRVLDALGQGGMGQVFLAEDEMLGRKVAIKTVLPAVSGEGEARARFVREARAMATVEHPRVVRVYSFGETAGQAYFVMEFVEGETLAARLERTPKLPVAEALRIGREVAEALAAAWARGLVHRDVKPSNIILDAEGHAHVADFGLARPTSVGADPAITREGMFVGSPHYVSPEQVRAETADFRADIYSLGIVLYEMLCGRRPFEGKSAMEVISRHLGETAPPLQACAPETPAPVAQLVHTMIAKEPTLRPDSYPTLIAHLSGTWPALDAGESELPTGTMPAPMRAPAPAPVARTPRPRWLTRGVPLVLAAALVGAWLVHQRLSRLPRPPGALVLGLASFAGSGEESAEEAQTLTTLVETEVQRILADEEGRSVGVVTAPESPSSARDARRLGERVGADFLLWGEVIAFRGEVGLQPVLTRVDQNGGSSPRLPGLLFEQQAPNPLEARRREAVHVAEAVARLAAQSALGRGDAEAALALLSECEPTIQNLMLRAVVLDRLGHAAEAEAARQQARVDTGREQP